MLIYIYIYTDRERERERVKYIIYRQMTHFEYSNTYRRAAPRRFPEPSRALRNYSNIPPRNSLVYPGTSVASELHRQISESLEQGQTSSAKNTFSEITQFDLVDVFDLSATAEQP